MYSKYLFAELSVRYLQGLGGVQSVVCTLGEERPMAYLRGLLQNMGRVVFGGVVGAEYLPLTHGKDHRYPEDPTDSGCTVGYLVDKFM